VDVSDRGSFLRRKPLPGRGFGLRIIGAIAGGMRIDTSRGTCVSMTFRTATRRSKS
jgi:GMP synthase PP-ATPase subunit